MTRTWSDALVVEEGAITGVEPEIAPEPEQKKSKARATAKAVKAKAVKAEKAEAKATKKSAKKAKAPAARKGAKKVAAKPAKKKAPRRRRRGSEHVTKSAPGKTPLVTEKSSTVYQVQKAYTFGGASRVVEAPDPEASRSCST